MTRTVNRLLARRLAHSSTCSCLAKIIIQAIDIYPPLFQLYSRAYPEQHSMLTYFLVLQILKFPLARHIDSLCPDCEAAAAATSSGRRRR